MIKVGIDIGNSKLSCIVSNYKDKKNISILSIKSTPSTNIKKNIILNYDSLLDQIKSLIIESEKNSQTKINSVNLNLPLLDHKINYYTSEIFLQNEKISKLHLNKLVNNSEYFNKETDYTDIFNNIISNEMDKKIVNDIPLEVFAEYLKINFLKINIKNKIINNFSNLFNKININIENYIPSPISSSLSVLSDDEKKLGTICLDLGHSNTSIVIFDNNKCVYVDSFQIGSNNITNDIAKGTSTTISSAERLKTLYGSIHSSPSDEYEIIEIPVISSDKNSFKQINRITLNSIIKPRVEETLEMAWQKIKQYNFHYKKIKNVVVTGGGSQLEGIDEYVKMIFSSNVRIGKPHEFLNLVKEFNKPNYSDVVGTIIYDKNDFSVNFLSKSSNIKKKYGISGFFSWLDQYI